MDQHFPHHHHHHHHHQQQQPQQHRTRYAPVAPQQSHHHNPHNLPPPPPLPQPPPPPPLSYRTIHTPPPQPYNPPPPHQSSQFPFYPHRPIEEERPLSTTNHHHHSSFSNRTLPDDHHPRRIDRIDRCNPEPLWNPSTDDRPTRNYPPLDFDRELHHHHHRPPPPPPPPLSYPPLRYDAEGGCARERHEGNTREDFVWGRGNSDGSYHRRVPADAAPNQAAMSRDSATATDSKSGGYGRVYDVECDADVSTRAGRVDTRRWVNDRKGLRELHDSFNSFELVNNEIGGVPVKREYYGSEIVRYNSNNCRGNNSREYGHEFTRTPPKKQIQKKSALLRLQTVKPNHRSRDVEQLRYAGYVPESNNNNFFRGNKEQHGYFSGHGMKAEEKEESSVELDISFESNSLVAKAIVPAPSSSGAPVSDSNTTSVSDANLEKSKKVSVSDGDCAGSQPAKLSSGGGSLNNSPCKANDNTSQKNEGDTCSQPCTTSNPHEKNKVAVSGKVSDSCSGKSSARVVKKKKIVKRVVKKAVVNPKSTVSRLPSANAVGGTVQADSVTLSSSTASGPVKTETCLEEKNTAVDKVSVPDCSHSLPKEGNVLTDDNKGDSSLLSLGPDCRSQECKADEDSNFGKVSRFERGGSISNSPSRASSSEVKNSGSDCLDANNSVHDLLSMPNIDKVTKSLNGSTSSEISHMDYGNEQLIQNEVSLSPGKCSNVGCPENRNLVDVGDEMNCKLSSSADSVISTDIIDTHNSANDRVYSFNSNYLTGSEEKFTVTDSGNNDIVGKAYCDNIAPSITQYAILEENSDTVIPMPSRSSGTVAFSCSGNTRIQDGLDCLPRAGVLKQGSDNGSSPLEDSITVQHFGIMKDSEKQVSLGEVAISSDNCDTEKTFPISNISVGSDERDTNMAPTFTHDAILQENSDAAIPHPSSGVIALSSSVNTRIQDGLDCLQHAGVLKQGSDNGSSTLEDSITVQHFGIMNNSGKQVFPSEVAISSDNCQRDTNKNRKRKVRTHLNFVSSNRDDISPDRVNLVSHANDADRGSNLLLKDPCPSEVLDHSVQSLDFDLQSNLDGVTALHGKRGILEAEFCVGNNDNDDANKVSPVSKRKKVTASLPNFTQCQSEFSDAIVATTSNSEFPISFSDNRAHQKEVALSNVGILSIARSMPYSDDIAKSSDSILAGGSFGSIDANREAMSSEHLELQHSDMVSYSPSAFPNVQFSVFGCEPKENITPIVPISNSNTQTDILVTRNIEGEKTDSQAVEIDYHYSDIVHRSPRADMESNDLNMKDDLLAQQNLMSCPANGDGVTTSDSNDELIQDSPDALSDMCSRGMVSEVPDRSIIELTAIHDENFCGDEENPNDISMVKHGSDSHTFTPSMQHTEKIMKSDHAIGHRDPIKRNIMPEPTQVYPKVTTQGLNSYCSGLDGSKNQPGGVILKTFQGHSFAFSKSKTKTSSSSIHNSTSRTWHRAGNNNPPTSLPRIKPSAGTFPPKRPTLERKGNFQNTSYIRKGNSLVRKPTPASAIPQVSSANRPPLGLDEIPKNTRSEGRADVTDQSIYLKTAVSSAPLKRQKTPPLPIDTKSEEKISSPLVEPPSSGCCENTSDPRKFIETNDAPDSSEDVLKQYETPENQTGPSNNGESQFEANDGNISSLNSKKIVYIKPKTNKLVATSNACDVIISTDDKGQTAFSDSYYKRRKNQLVRTTFESHINQTVAMPNSTVNSDGQRASKVLSNRRFTKRRSHKVAGISCKSSRASLVWTLRSKNSSENDRGSSHYQKVLPHLFPWKRTTYLRSFIHNSASSFNSSSLSAIGKKLLLLRKRDTVYTRSTHGFSLWKSKVLGVGGSSLKWSKSIEKHSKKANEEATLAVAAVEKKKREHKDVACIGSQAKRERIFRIGSVRYRMDPSRRTLQRISDDESQSSSICSGLAAKRAYIPRRLMIGNDEYVRIGNGNQLIRDPKKRTRKLANEKVRWSLHTARQRLARKQKYCQFFTRFGKCNKDGGKCPYIHDPSKIAVCTKFLNGLCSTPNCKLTHKVIPERMPDCSYFLQGLCSNGTCPYRHVNVNPKASICEGFLKGYCADGNECRKKHSYVCPTFEATGTCAQGTKCKLHHPKKQSKGKKRKRSGDQNNCRGRYFGSIPVDVSEPGTMLPPREHQQQNDELEKELSDYISLDVIEEEAADTVDQSFEPSTFCDNNSLDLQLDTCDELIKPFLLISKFTSQSSQSSSLQA